MQTSATNPTACRPIFATPNPLLIAGIREVLAAAGIPADPRVVSPEGLAETLAHTEAGLVILDGQSLPHRDILAGICVAYPRSQFVVWAAQPNAELLRTALECGIQGLLSTRLPLDEASHALLRISRGERLFRFDPGAGSIPNAKPLQFTQRERHVLAALAGGASNAAIASALQTTPSTVKGCLARLFRKTGAHNRQELGQLGHAMLRAAEQPKNPTDEPCFDESWMLDRL